MTDNLSHKRKFDELETDTESDNFLNYFLEERKVTKKSYEDVLYDMIEGIEKSSGTYLNAENIIEDFKKSLLENREGMMNKCLECGIDMGRHNPRQLCGKTYCITND